MALEYRFPRSARLALAGALAVALALAASGYAVYHSGLVSHIDTAAFWAFAGIGHTHARLASLASLIANTCDVKSFMILALIPLGIALARGRLAVAVAVVAICGLAPLTTEVLKPLLAGPRPPSGLPLAAVSQGSWPSGHSTAAMALALSCVIAVPRRLRPWAAAVGGAFALAVAYSVLILGWHFPSDALAGMAVGAFWTLVAVAGVAVADARWGRAPGAWHPLSRRWEARRGLDGVGVEVAPAGHLPSTVTVLAVAALPAGVLLLLKAGRAVSYTYDHPSFVVMVVALACVAMASTWSVLAAARRPSAGGV